MAWSQNQTNKWYFGNYAGLDFNTNPPTALLNGALNDVEGCASISDLSGNILIYTNGQTVWDKTHTIMANGTGLFGVVNPIQSSLIIQRPSSANLYYIFTVAGAGNALGFNYSVVDLNLALANGSVTIKNNPLFPAPCAEKIAGTKHCNGIDYWIVIHELYTSSFYSYLLTAAGVSSMAIVSSIGSNYGDMNYLGGNLKFSPNGKKLGVTTWSNSIEMYDFDPSTGVVSNSMILGSGIQNYSCE